ncbi:MAG: hypothetical protein LIO94_11175 [Clostridiales bacterium]|nr:hypothetical protein [Clostridiales bacterium]
MEQDFNYLIERLTVRELFTLDGSLEENDDVRSREGDVVGKLELLKEDLEDMEISGTPEEVCSKGKTICMASDGLNLVNDCGGDMVI